MSQTNTRPRPIASSFQSVYINIILCRRQTRVTRPGNSRHFRLSLHPLGPISVHATDSNGGS